MDYLNLLAESLGIPVYLLILILIWSLIWKGIALWKAARKNNLFWFILILLINTIGILEILYVFVFSEMDLMKKNFAKKKRKKVKKFV